MARWNIDTAHTSIEFAVRHMMVTTVRGTFGGVTGFVDYDEDAVGASVVDVTIDTSTVNTHVGDRDNHLRSPDFLDVANHPTMTFKSTQVTPKGRAAASIEGDLTIRGTTKKVTLEAEFFGTQTSNWGDVRAGFQGTTKINREDWGLTWNQALEAGGVLVGKDVTLTIDLQVIRVAEGQPA